MANVISTQILIDGPRNVSVKIEGVLDTGDVANTVLLDPALLQGIDFSGAVKAAKLRIMEIQFTIEDTLAVNLLWDATTPVRIGEYTGRGKQCYHDFGGLQNNAGAGVNGKILWNTQGASAGPILSFTVVVDCVKQQT